LGKPLFALPQPLASLGNIAVLPNIVLHLLGELVAGLARLGSLLIDLVAHLWDGRNKYTIVSGGANRLGL